MPIVDYLRHLKHPTYPWVFSKFKNDTMVQFDDYCANLRLANCFRHVGGAVVECGTWKGGMIAGLASILGNERSYFLFDSFEGLPPARQIDGEAALRWQADTDSPRYFDNCRASVEDARTAMRRAGIDKARIMRGWFEDTLPGLEVSEGIAILRMDGDWYDSTMCILENFFHQVVPGGCIIIDDYPWWDGCSRAVHDFLSRASRPERISRFNDRVAFMIKRD